MQKTLTRCAAICLGLFLSGAVAAASKPGRQVQDPHYGDVLFYFYQDNFFEAITRLMAAREVGRAKAHTEDGDLLMGGMLLSYGQHEQAAAIFRHLLDTSTKPAVRDRAWFYLARVSYERAALNQAEEALGHIGTSLPERLEAERQILRAQVLMAQSRYDEAAAILKDWKGPPDWAGYARFNLGIALIRAERGDEGLKLLDEVGNAVTNDPEQLALRDRANLALGFAAIQAEQPATAVTALQRVRLEGPYSNKALLGLGWAESALDHDRDALVQWQELQKRELIDPAVQESFLAVPYALARLHANNLAAARYQDAIKTFETETGRLDASIANIRGGKLLSALLAEDSDQNKDKKGAPDQLGAGLHLEKLPNTTESNYLVYLLASRPFQEGLKNYRDLRFLHDNLTQWTTDVAVFSDMLSTQKLAYQQRQPKVTQALQQIDLDAIDHQRGAYSEHLRTIEDKQDGAGLANATELRQLASLENINARIAALGNAPEAEGLREQVRLLKGVLLWNLDHDYKLRLWQQKRAQTALDDAVAQAQAQRHAVDDAQQGIPARLAGFAQRVDKQTPRIAELKQKTDTLLSRQQAFLQDLAVHELEQYKARLHQYTVEARFALAQIYDRAAEQETPGGAATAPVPAAVEPAPTQVPGQ